MNCQQFTSLIVEAARGQMMDAAARDDAMRHAEMCAACAARLAQERNLTGALRTVAADMKDSGAPARLEAKLLAAFPENLAQALTATNATPAPAASHAGAGASPHAGDEIAARRLPASNDAARRLVAMAVAASLVLVALATLYQLLNRVAPSQHELVTNIETPAGRDSLPERERVESSATTATTAMPTPVEFMGRPERERPQQTPSLKSSGRTSPKIARSSAAAAPKMIASRQVIDGGNAVFATGDAETAANPASGASRINEAESVTEFIPLVAGASAAAPLEGGQLVRVQLPRAALASLGLPLNAERGNEPVKADVLLGNDGLARAIRFVR